MGARKGNVTGLVHGGEGAVKSIQKGEPLRGLARETELQVIAELETEGRYALVKRNAIRLQAACDLYWSALSKAAEQGEMRRLDSYTARFGWLAGCSLRAWAQVKAEQPDESLVTDYEEILERERHCDLG